MTQMADMRQLDGDTNPQEISKPVPQGGFFSSLFTAVAGGVGAYALTSMFGDASVSPTHAAAVAASGAGILSLAVAGASQMPGLFAILGVGGFGLTRVFSWLGSMAAGSSGADAGLGIAGVLMAAIATPVIADGGDSYGDELSMGEVFTGLMAGVALSAALAFSTASIPGSSAPQQNTPEKTDVQTVPAAPAP